MASPIDAAVNALKVADVPADIREILSGALSFAADLARQNSDLQSQVEVLRDEVEGVTFDRDQARTEAQTLRDAAQEEIRVHETLEFRKGLCTGDAWVPFCPICHIPISSLMFDATVGSVICSDRKCGFRPGLTKPQFDNIVRSFVSANE